MKGLFKVSEVKGRKGKKSKFSNEKMNVEGIIFDSRREGRHYGYLKLRERTGEIKDLELQPKFPIYINNILVFNYVADFSYIENKTGEKIITDCKGFLTDVYKIKKKCVEAYYKIKILEV